MAFKQLTYSAATVKTDMKDISDDLINDFNAQDKKIGDLKTSLGQDTIATEISLKALLDRVGTSPLDMWSLRIEIAKIMPDILADPNMDDARKCLNYMELVIFKIAPETRQIKAGKDQDKHWHIRCRTVVSKANLNAYITRARAEYNADPTTMHKITVENDDDHTMAKKIRDLEKHWLTVPIGDTETYEIGGTITMATFKTNTPPTAAPAVTARAITLTMKQASLVAVDILNCYTELAVASNMVVLTPLAGAIFSRASVEEMLNNPVIAGLYKTKHELVVAINSSAQSGGQHLPYSRSDIAAVCTHSATQGMTDKKAAKAICTKTVRQFVNGKRPHDIGVVSAFGAFATGGVPTYLSYEAVDAELNLARLAYKNAQYVALN
ncbi:nucleocapsid protein [Yongsan bunyavirus 1]|uniref:nucleocapsid protein n=1 Tax=Yongsan bunyavirus 1 TaxID=2315803 RepID=UPI000EB644EF|nr:nucleocapsid protein [Yongsan bunyavirus 1]AXV43871.1 nucleocapsid protein [Yongsan bunyavirus 1]